MKSMPCGARFNLLGDVWEALKEPRQVINTAGSKKAQKSCPECGLARQEEFDWCPGCGFRLAPYQCAYCRGFVPGDEKHCPSCGAPLV